MSGSRVLTLSRIAIILVVSGAGAPGDRAAATAAAGRNVQFPVLVENAHPGKLLIRFPRPVQNGPIGRFLYQVTLRTGLGSNDFPIDRARPAEARILVLRRIGGKVFAQFENTAFRASNDAEGAFAASQSFAPSTIWSGDAVEQADGGLVVDFSGFAIRDAFGIADAVMAGQGGSHKLDPSLSAVDERHDIATANGLEFEAVGTFVSDAPVNSVKSVTVAIAWLYGDERSDALAGRTAGLRYATDADAASPATGQRWATTWDDGCDPVRSLDSAMQVRAVALAKFGLRNLPDGAPVAELRQRIVPVYLYHRYQVIAAAKLVGGADYGYAVKGDGRERAIPVAPDDQRRALVALMSTVAPAFLDLSDQTVALLSAGQRGMPDRQFEREIFPTTSGPLFDLPAAAESAAGLTIGALLAPDRLNRLADQKSRNSSQLGDDDVLDALIGTAFPRHEPSGRLREIQHRVASRLIAALETTREARELSPAVAERVDTSMQGLLERLTQENDPRADLAGIRGFGGRVRHAIERNDTHPQFAENPPGIPIGGETCWLCK